jgi:hypothetical protein
MILVAIIGLVVSVPIQCHRATELHDCQLAAHIHDDAAKALTIIANHPARWMDEYRLVLRRLASWEREQSDRLFRSSVYDRSEENRIVQSFMDSWDHSAFWRRFNFVAAREGYQRPVVWPSIRRGGGQRQGMESCIPTFCAIGLLGCGLVVLRRNLRGRAKAINVNICMGSGDTVRFAVRGSGDTTPNWGIGGHHT